MRLAPVALALAAVVPAARAQVPCGLGGVTYTVTPSSPQVGESITLDVQNNSGQTIVLTSGCLFTGIFGADDCSGSSIVFLACPAVIVMIPNGGTFAGVWNQTDAAGAQVPSGDYSFEARYFDSGFGTGFTCCIPFTIRPVTPGTSLCSGDGGDQLGCTDCPCGNNAVAGTVGGCLNSAGTSTRLDASGDPSVSLPAGSTTDLRLSLTGAPAAATAVLFSGAAVAPTNPANPCFGLDSGAQSIDRDGLRCAVQNILRHGNRQTDAAGEVDASSGPSRAWGGESSPNAGLAATSGFVAGQTRYFQITHRDDPTVVCMRGLNTSQAVEVTFAP